MGNKFKYVSRERLLVLLVICKVSVVNRRFRTGFEAVEPRSAMKNA